MLVIAKNAMYDVRCLNSMYDVLCLMCDVMTMYDVDANIYCVFKEAADIRQLIHTNNTIAGFIERYERKVTKTTAIPAHRAKRTMPLKKMSLAHGPEEGGKNNFDNYIVHRTSYITKVH